MIRKHSLAAFISFLASFSVVAEPAASSDDTFEQLHAMLKPRPGESRWMEIDWHPSVWEGRKRAAAEGKPLFLMAGSGGAPCAGC